MSVTIPANEAYYTDVPGTPTGVPDQYFLAVSVLVVALPGGAANLKCAVYEKSGGVPTVAIGWRQVGPISAAGTVHVDFAAAGATPPAIDGAKAYFVAFDADQPVTYDVSFNPAYTSAQTFASFPVNNPAGIANAPGNSATFTAGIGAWTPPEPPPTSSLAMDNLLAYAAVTTSQLVFLDWSDTRGRGYGNPVSQPIGDRGEYLTSVSWNRLGYARDRVFRVTWSVPVPTALQGAFIEADTSAKT